MATSFSVLSLAQLGSVTGGLVGVGGMTGGCIGCDGPPRQTLGAKVLDDLPTPLEPRRGGYKWISGAPELAQTQAIQGL